MAASISFFLPPKTISTTSRSTAIGLRSSHRPGNLLIFARAQPEHRAHDEPQKRAPATKPPHINDIIVTSCVKSTAVRRIIVKENQAVDGEGNVPQAELGGRHSTTGST